MARSKVWTGTEWIYEDISYTGDPRKKTLTNLSENYTEENNIVTVTDADVTANNFVTLYPADETTEQWLEANLVSCIITQASGSFSFKTTDSLPATFSMYYIITEVQ